MTYKNSFYIILSLMFLVPLSFFPGGALPLLTIKATLLTVGVIIATLVFLYEIWNKGRVALPKHYLLVVVAVLPLVYLLSAVLTTPSSLALLGYNLEQGTFGFILIGSASLLLTSLVFSNSSKVFRALTVFFITFSIVAIFATIKILVGGDFLAMGQLFTNMGSPLGNWTDLAIIFGLLAVFTALTLRMLPLTYSVKILFYAVFALSTLLMVVINFSTAFAITLGASVLLWLYFTKIERGFLYSNNKAEKIDEDKRAVMLPIILGAISLLFLINPTISETRGNLGNVVSQSFGVSNADVRPSLSATLGVSKQVLSLSSLLGSGPNTFGQDWLIYKPANINTTPFWALAFPYGVGFLPTQIATTGILGSAFWLSFIVLYFILATKALSHIPESRAIRFPLVSTLLVGTFLWVAAIFYTPSGAVLFLAFIFVGLFIASSQEAGIVPSRVLKLKDSPQHRFASIFVLGLLSLGAFWFSWLIVEKTLASYYFQRAISLSNIENTPLQEIEDVLDRAIRLYPNDRYYIALSRLNFFKAELAAQGESDTKEKIQENQTIFQESLSKSTIAARSAVSINPAGYQNWVFLGSIYSALVPAPLSVDGAYENALYAYNEARRRNPNNPEVPLLLAQLELNKGNVEQSRSYIRGSMALKEDYADAYLALAKLEVAQGNTAGAIASAERLSTIMPNNPGVYLELGLLKYSSSDYSGAQKAFIRALELSPEYANAKYHLALSLNKLGQREKAKIYLEELLVTNPDNTELRAVLRDLE